MGKGGGGTNKECYGIFQSDLLPTELRFAFQDIQVQYVALIVLDSRRGGLIVGVLDSGSSGPGSGPGWGHCVCVLGQDTLLSRRLSSPRCTNGYRRIAAGNPAMDWHPIQGKIANTTGCFMLMKPEISAGLIGPSGS